MAQDDISNSNSQTDGKMSRSEAGKLGGDKVLRERGREYYEEIGSQQGKENNPGNFANRDKKDVQDAGRAGGSASSSSDSSQSDNN
jgi:general stress protein YciG